ncbi:MAG: tetratricopeptide repeat protein [Pirellulales bacterium]
MSVTRVVVSLAIAGYFSCATSSIVADPLIKSAPIVRTDPVPAAPNEVRADRDPDVGPYAPSPPTLRGARPLPSGQGPGKLPTHPDARPIAGGAAEWDDLIQRTSAIEEVEPGTRTARDLADERAADLEAVDVPKIEAAKMGGVTPGETSWTTALEKFGEPRSSNVTDGHGTAAFNFPPFDGAEVVVEDGVVASVVVLPGKALDPDAAAKQLGLDEVRSVVVRDKNGAKLGIAFPEKGVLFCYNVEGTGITQLILEPIDAEAFVLRAEAALTAAPRKAYVDIESALFDDPKCVAALRLKARLLGEMGHWTDAFAALKQAFRLAPTDTQTRLLSAEMQNKTGGYREAKKALDTLLSDTRLSPETRARAECLLGDVLASGPQRDDAGAEASHGRAQDCRIVDERSEHGETPPRQTRDGRRQLGYRQRHRVGVLPTEKRRRAALVGQGAGLRTRPDRTRRGRSGTRISSRASRAGRLRRHARATRSDALDQGRALRPQSRGREERRSVAAHRLSWELGLALYDALQCDQARGVEAQMLTNSTMVVKHLEDGAAHREQTDIDAFMLGRLYYRIGAIFAIRKNDHAKATLWYGKALPLVEEPLPDASPGDLARHGETLVSMGLSYFEAGKEGEGVRLTRAGIEHMRTAVKAQALPEASLAVPYGNLASMLKAQGAGDEARSFETLANRADGSKRR